MSILYDFLILTHEYLAVFRKPEATTPTTARVWRPFVVDESVSADLPTATTARVPCDTCSLARALEVASDAPEVDATAPLGRAFALHSTRKPVPSISLLARGRVLGTVWCLNATTTPALHRLATAQMVRAHDGPCRPHTCG